MRRTVAFLIMMSLASANVRADETQASQLFRAGQAAHERGDHEAAARAFEEAHKQAPRGAAVYNAGLSWRAAGQLARAADLLAEALKRDDLNAEQRQHAEKTLEEVRRRVVVVQVAEPAGVRVSVAHVQEQPTPTTFHLPPGEHQLRLSAADGTALGMQPVEAAEGGTVVLQLRVPEPPPVAAAAPPPPEVGVSAPPPVVKPSRAPAWAFLGLAVGAGVTAGVLGARTMDAKGDYEDSQFSDRQAYTRARDGRLWTNVAIGSAVVLGGLALWRFWVTR